MNDYIIKDLLKHKSRDICVLLDQFNRNGSQIGYLFNGPDAKSVQAQRVHEKAIAGGLYCGIWDSQARKLSARDLVLLLSAPQHATLKVLGYAANEQHQTLLMEKPEVYLSKAAPHILVSWGNKSNPVAAGFMQFGPVPSHMNIPTELRNGGMLVVMHNSREMDITPFRQVLDILKQQRMAELAQKLPPEVRQELDANYASMDWSAFKTKFISDGFSFNEQVAQMYAHYKMDATKDKVPTRSEVEEAEELEDAEYDKRTDEQNEQEDELGLDNE